MVRKRRTDNLQERYDFHRNALLTCPNKDYGDWLRNIAEELVEEYNLDIACGLMELFVLCIKDTEDFNLATEVVNGLLITIFTMNRNEQETLETITQMMNTVIEEADTQTFNNSTFILQHMKNFNN